MKQLIQSLILFIVALVLAGVAFPFGILFVLYRTLFHFTKSTPIGYLSYVGFSLAVAIDVVGNVICGPLFNFILLKKVNGSNIYFGNISHTVSLIIGLNYRMCQLSKIGMLLYKVIEKLDPGHFENCIKDYQDPTIRTYKYFY
jgi:hypothetical protein